MPQLLKPDIENKFTPDQTSLFIDSKLEPKDQDARLNWIRSLLKQIPDTAGVYYFYGQQDEPLYIGKSVHIRQRLMSHLNTARQDERALRFICQTHRLAWRCTYGDIHAQLLENREIKAQFPIFNRAQRRLKQFFSWNFAEKNPLHLELSGFKSDKVYTEQNRVCYGIYKNARQARESLKTIADREQLCLRVLGLEKGRGPCFRSQINKCAGACAGSETKDEMVSRLLDAFLPYTLQLWPYAGPVQFLENSGWHLVYQWQSFGVFSHKLTASEVKTQINTTPIAFDKDEYRIIRRLLLSNPI